LKLPYRPRFAGRSATEATGLAPVGQEVTCLELGSACWLNAVQSKKRAGGEVVSNLSKCVLGLLVQGS